MLALIGSRALMFRAPFLLDREPKDFDFICSDEDDIEKFISDHQLNVQNREKIADNKHVIFADVPFEFEVAEPNSSSHIFLSLMHQDKLSLNSPFGWIPSLELLFLLKESHKYLKNSPHFWKTARDIHVMRKLGLSVDHFNDEFKALLKLREKETYKNKLPKLVGMKSKDFFKDDGILYQYDHDSLHETVKHLEKPAYCYYMKDGSEVETDKEKFFAVDQRIRLLGGLEESYVLALERSQIPFPEMPRKKSFLIAISKVASSITSGYFRKFVFDHIFEIVKMYEDSYVDRFLMGLENGTVKPFQGRDTSLQNISSVMKA